MAGIVLSSQKLAEMNDANFRAMKTAKGQLKEALALNADLHAKMALMQSQRDTAESQIKRLLDLLERTQAQRDAAQSELNRALVVVNAARALCRELSDGVLELMVDSIGRTNVEVIRCKRDAARVAK